MKINTSISIEEKTLNKAKGRADNDKRSLSQIVEFALEAYLK